MARLHNKNFLKFVENEKLKVIRFHDLKEILVLLFFEK